ncbi:hypothetical protein CAC42_6247 [Sphaceloma murrayae]|uniref:Uncharacterized protein n=1 Tax=Sphaceloma murrayae TaxID=2082308 RepID=A0A2K1QTZ8_9PEZI|nr:hypothetical protein CAC42_6247 [Sphaceloma murrayae]
MGRKERKARLRNKNQERIDAERHEKQEVAAAIARRNKEGREPKWGEKSRMEHHCPVCQTALLKPSAKKTCVNRGHVAPCPRYHEGLMRPSDHTCTACRQENYQHDKRHIEILRQFNDTNILAEATDVPTTTPTPKKPPNPIKKAAIRKQAIHLDMTTLVNILHPPEHTKDQKLSAAKEDAARIIGNLFTPLPQPCDKIPMHQIKKLIDLVTNDLRAESDRIFEADRRYDRYRESEWYTKKAAQNEYAGLDPASDPRDMRYNGAVSARTGWAKSVVVVAPPVSHQSESRGAGSSSAAPSDTAERATRPSAGEDAPPGVEPTDDADRLSAVCSSNNPTSDSNGLSADNSNGNPTDDASPGAPSADASPAKLSKSQAKRARARANRAARQEQVTTKQLEESRRAAQVAHEAAPRDENDALRAKLIHMSLGALLDFIFTFETGSPALFEHLGPVVDTVRLVALLLIPLLPDPCGLRERHFVMATLAVLGEATIRGVLAGRASVHVGREPDDLVQTADEICAYVAWNAGWDAGRFVGMYVVPISDTQETEMELAFEPVRRHLERLRDLPDDTEGSRMARQLTLQVVGNHVEVLGKTKADSQGYVAGVWDWIGLHFASQKYQRLPKRDIGKSMHHEGGVVFKDLAEGKG